MLTTTLPRVYITTLSRVYHRVERGWVIKSLWLQGHLEQQRSYSCQTRTLSALLSIVIDLPLT
jgi:hypothetical protein